MKFAIVISKKDPAGLNIYNFLKNKNLPNASLHLMGLESVRCENIDKQVSADLFIFATKHQSESKIPSLSVHSPGNWGMAEFGGKDKKLCVAPANYLRGGFLKLEELNKRYNLNFEVVQECTHHGPYLEKPVMFIEIGSSEEQWVNKTAGKIIAEAILCLINNKPGNCKVAFGIGGLHTTPSFRKLLNHKIAVGHVCPKYMLENLDKEMVLQAIEKTYHKNDLIVLDWKGLQQEKGRVVNILNDLNMEYLRTKDFS